MKSLRLKRSFDVAAVVLSTPLWLPLLAIVALLVYLKVGTPVFFRQKRPGFRGEIFELIKFRSMRDDRDASGQLLPDAVRLTPFGRRLRSTSLDELPELLNVLRGEMSLVGPRPLLVSYLSRYSFEEARRHDAPPGLTGWTQVNGRNALSWDEKFAMDIWYVNHRNLWLDARILFRTLWQVASRHGISAPGEATMAEFRPPPHDSK